MNRYKYPVVRVGPADMDVVAEHLTYAEAVADAALRDAQGEPGVWHRADEPGCTPDYARTR
ncbi:hypothetical protein [Actinoplanes rectilineatus]|uniref:hypothetical protein n=1 Tax=Actinoplanes rectilineatus TaxID=113571 RepID=UPI000A6B84A3|nr:hypothetical protein [Actinoplanes rectilineatus]